MYLIKSTDQQLLKYVEWKSCLKSKIISYVSIYNCIHCVYLCKKKMNNCSREHNTGVRGK